jgi:bifunctional non-homologous end joining protein LigD
VRRAGRVPEESVARDDELSEETGDSLEAYRRKRSADRTPEPFDSSSVRPGLFVVQQHAATRLHYDFRLELDGVLVSWAVPRGPSLDPAEKRLAVHVEDHPVDYADFEGVIPEGNYGAGAVILWDRGRWRPLEDPVAGLASGKLLFELEGYKLGGRFTLVRTGGKQQPAGREWLLIKKPDAYAREGEDDALDESSVLSGLRLDELRDGPARIAALRDEMLAAGARATPVAPDRVKLMLAERLEAPFSDPDWLFEVKYDGYRMLGSVRAGEAALATRNGHAAGARFPEVVRALEALPVAACVLDGEIAVTDRAGRPRFHRLQQRARLSRRPDIERATVTHPATYFVFDLLGFEDLDLRPLPLVQRKGWLERLLPRFGPLRYAEHFAERGEDVFRAIEAQGLEGMLAKRADAPYRGGRSPAWKKLRILATEDLVVVGFTLPKPSRAGFGALHLAWNVGGELVYAGRVGTGFRESELVALREGLDAIARDSPPCGGPLPLGPEHRWVEPQLVAEVRYAEETPDGLLRQPAFVGLRDDKLPEECLRPDDRDHEAALDALDRPLASPVEREVPFTNEDKIFWPEEGITKGELLGYYRDISPWLLPYLADRPLVMTRYPDGVAGKSFYQKDAPEWVPDWIRREVIYSEHAEREVHYFVCDDLESLLYVINMGTIPLHVWSSRAAALSTPDWCILDLDPKGAPFADVLTLARVIRDLCEELELPSFPKTSGSTGLHVLLPLGAVFTYEQSRTFAELLARLVVQTAPQIATTLRNPRAREGKVYVDYLQNRHGQLLVAPFSVRPLPGAPVSMPVRWREVNAKLSNERFTLANAVARMKRLGPWPMRWHG